MPVPVSNRLLTSLSPVNARALLALSTAVSLPLRTVLYEPPRAPRYAFFITSGIASVVSPMADGGMVEVELIGNEGFSGSLHLLGPAPVQTTCFMQVGGTGLRIELSKVRELFHASEEISERVHELVQFQALTVGQMVGCNRLHDAEARLARWLMMARDRAQSDVLNLTQVSLAEMLGTQRTTVTATAGVLQRAGLIQYRQGQVTIVDGPGLDAAACECYGVTKRLYAGLYRKS